MGIYKKISGTASFIMSLLFSVTVIFSGSYAMVSLFDNISSSGLDKYSTLSYDDINAMFTNMSGISLEDDVLGSELLVGVKDVIYSFENQENYTLDDARKDAEQLINETIGSTEIMMEVNNFLRDVETKLDGLLANTDVDEQIRTYIDKLNPDESNMD